MRMLWTLGICVLMVCVGRAMAAQVEIAPDRMLLVNGERTFVLGLYENPQDDAVLREAAEAGFNLFHAGANQESLDRLEAAGAFGWLNLGGNIDLSTSAEARRQNLERLVDELGTHPALLVWEVPDEALWNCWYSRWLWRRRDEPRMQREAIEALEDGALAEVLGARRDEVDELWEQGQFAEAEEAADGVWHDLGKDSPKPGFDVSTAAEAADRLCEGMLEGYLFMKSLGVQQPIWMNHAPRNQIAQLAAFGQAADIVGCDIYPVPEYRGGHSDLGDRSLSSVGAYTLRMQESAPGKPVWMVLQGFGWADLNPNADEEDKEVQRRPDYEETRLMAYDAIVRGARGILYWGTSYVEKDSQFWQDLMAVARELKGLLPVLAAPDTERTLKVDYPEAWGSLDRGVVVLGKEFGEELWLLVASEWPEALVYTLDGLDGLDGTVYEDTATKRRVVVEEGRISLSIPEHGVQVLAPVGGNGG